MLLRAVFAIVLAAQAAAPPDHPAEIAIHDTPGGPVFAASNGMSLYVFDRDVAPSVSTCTGACAAAWPPIAAPANATSVGDWTEVARPDGLKQWAYKGRPLYRYAQELKAGGTYGDGGGSWHLALTSWQFPGRPGAAPKEANAAVPATELPALPAGVTARRVAQGIVLADFRGMTLYAFDKDTPGATPSCNGQCLLQWRPLAAPLAAHPVGAWTVIARGDAALQWAYKGKPLYACLQDNKPGDTVCAFGDKGPWRVVAP